MFSVITITIGGYKKIPGNSPSHQSAYVGTFHVCNLFEFLVVVPGKEHPDRYFVFPWRCWLSSCHTYLPS